MSSPGGLCPNCWPTVRFLAEPLCERCGLPLAQPIPSLCGHCAGSNSPLGRSRAAFLYDEGSRNLVLHLKHADALAGVPVMARWMQRAGSALLTEADYLVPVPLHWTRLFKRRYNQSAELARAIARLARVPVLPDSLVRDRRTASQGHKNHDERRANVLHAFRVKERYRARINGRTIILIDDVMTTGATLEACAETLLSVGAARVEALTLARVEHGGPLS
jgi:ComF family protein